MDRSARLPGRSPAPALPAPRPRGGGGPRPRDSLRSAVGAPRCAPGLHEELEPPARSLSAPGDAATWGRERRAGNVSWTGLGARGGPGAALPGLLSPLVPHRCRNPRWVWSAGAGEKLRCDQPQQAPPERPAPHGHHVALLSSPSPATPSPRLPFTYARDPHPRDPILARSSPHCRAARDF